MHKPPRLYSTRPVNNEDPSGYFRFGIKKTYDAMFYGIMYFVVRIQLQQQRLNGKVIKIVRKVFNKRSGKDGISANKIKGLTKGIKKWLGGSAKVIKNKSGDTVIISAKGTKRVRFDMNNPRPHANPHGHVEELINGKWKKSGQLYPTDVPHK